MGCAAGGGWVGVGVAAAAAVWGVVAAVLAAVFPFWVLREQRGARPRVRTGSYRGRTAVVVGAHGAYGSRAARNLAERGAETLVLVDARDCAGLKARLEGERRAAGQRPPRIVVWQIDLMRFAGCRELRRRAAADLRHIDHLLLAVGILSFDRRESPDGWETSIQVNYLSTALLALLLLPLLTPSPSNPNPSTLTFATSFGVYPAYPTMASLPATGSFLRRLSDNRNGLMQKSQYGRSKALLLYFARELAARVSAAKGRRLPPITINSTDPGTAWTPLSEITRATWLTRIITDLGARDAQYGANTLTNGVSEGASAHGKLVRDFGHADYPPWMTRPSGMRVQQRVWQETQDELIAKVPEVKAVFDMLPDN